jgi:histidyl-tRNA synthetase
VRLGEPPNWPAWPWRARARPLPGLRLQVNAGAGSFKSQFKKADKSGALYA